MPRATCPCGHRLIVPAEDSARIVCPSCGARVRIRRRDPASDGYLRFYCPCGRRLKVRSEDPPKYGKCPDCGRTVPVPIEATAPLSASPSHPDTPTEELSQADRAKLERWSRDHQARAQAESSTSDLTAPPTEAGLRVCPVCGKPVHLGADACRTCGIPVPRR